MVDHGSQQMVDQPGFECKWSTIVHTGTCSCLNEKLSGCSFTSGLHVPVGNYVIRTSLAVLLPVSSIMFTISVGNHGYEEKLTGFSLTSGLHVPSENHAIRASLAFLLSEDYVHLCNEKH